MLEVSYQATSISGPIGNNGYKCASSRSCHQACSANADLTQPCPASRAPVVDSELILDSAVYYDHLPQAVEAFYFALDARDHRADQVDVARRVHAAFIQHFGVSNDTLPLLMIDDESIGAGETRPFKLIPDGLQCQSGTCEMHG